MTLPVRITLSLTLLLASVTCMTAREQCERTHLPAPVQLTDSFISRPIEPADGIESVTIEARGALPKIREGRGMSVPCWGIELTAPGDTLSVTLRFGNSDFGDLLDRRISVITVTRGDSKLYSGTVAGFHTGADRFNTLSVTLSDSTLCVTGGGDRCGQVCEVSVGNDFNPTEASVRNIGKMLLSVFSTEVCRPPYRAFASGYTREELDRHFATSTDPAEGYWRYFDRSVDPTFARIGGRYTLAVIRQHSEASSQEESFTAPTYYIIYIDGARTLADNWQPMMLKGVLRPTIFEGHYDLEWIDSTFDTITEDINAVITDRSLLTLNFPLLKSSLRFSKVPVSR